MALKLFPVEVWEVLLEGLAPQDAYNVYLAFPDFRIEPIIRNKVAEWMFFLVAHRICPYDLLELEDILNSRLVCRLWCQGIDNIIQHRPRYFAYPYDKEANGLLHLLNGSPFQGHTYNMIGDSSIFENVDILQEFQSKMDGRVRNPFLFRELHLQGVYRGPGVDLAQERGEDGLAPFWRASLEFVKTYGKHIWYLTIWSHDHDPQSLVRFLLPSLHFMPNLKALEVLGAELNHEDEEEINGIVGGYLGMLPPMAQLGCVDLSEDVIPRSLVHCLISAYGRQLKKTTINYNYWRDEYAHMFPNLTELTLVGGDIPDISRILTSIASPGLAKLSLDLMQVDSAAQRSMHASIVPMLSRFPGLEYFRIYKFNDYSQFGRPQRNYSLNVPNHSNRITSVKSLHIDVKTEAMNLDLLMCFPNLRNVRVNNLHLSFVNFYRGSPLLWEMACPSLEYVSTVGYKYGQGYSDHVFAREYYNRKREERNGRKDVEVDVEGISELFQKSELRYKEF